MRCPQALRRDLVWFCDSSFTRMRQNTERREEASNNQNRCQHAYAIHHLRKETQRPSSRPVDSLFTYCHRKPSSLVPQAIGWLQAAREK